DHEIAVADDPASRGVAEIAVRSTQEGLDPAHQLAQPERLGQVVVRAELEADHLVDLVVASGQDEDRRLRAGGAKPAKNLEPVNAGQADIEDDEVGRLVRGELEPLLAALCDGDLVALLLERVLDSARHGELVLDDQVHPVNRRPLHVDLFLVRMTEELTVDVPLVPTGTSSAVENLNGTLMHQLDSVRIRALPDHLPQSIEYSIESLVDFDTVVKVSDLTIPGDVTLLTDADEVVAKVLASRLQAEAAELAAETAAEA